MVHAQVFVTQEQRHKDVMSQLARTPDTPFQVDDPADLVSAFEQFSQLSETLQKSYEELDQRAARLTDELATANSERLQQLTEKEKLADELETLLGALPAGVVVIDDSGHIRKANRAAEAIFEQPLENRKWHQVYIGAIEGLDGQDIRLKNSRVISLSRQALDADHGEIILVNDVTHTRMLQSFADRHKRLAAMGEMAAGLAHQLRTPLASAVLYASQLDMVNLQQAQGRKAVDKIRTSLRYLDKLINDMLMYAKGGEFSNTRFSLHEFLVAFHTRLESKLRQSHTRFQINNSAGDISLTGSQDALVSVLMNLAENAMEACQQQCRLQLSVYSQSGYLILALKDNGPGISQDQQLHIFEPFYTGREKGTGLGLAVAQAIAHAHNGDLLVKSAPGHGSTFFLCLPLNAGDACLPSGQMTTDQLTGSNHGDQDAE